MKNKMSTKHIPSLIVDNEIELYASQNVFRAASLREALKGMHIIYIILYTIFKTAGGPPSEHKDCGVHAQHIICIIYLLSEFE